MHPDKSLVGTLAFFVSAILVVLLAPKIAGTVPEYGIWVVGALGGAITEAWVTGVDDNITVPFSIGLIMWGLYVLLLPELNLAFLT